MPVRNTERNSSPFAVCRVISETVPEESSSSSAAATSAVSVRKSMSSPSGLFFWNSFVTARSSSMFSSRASSCGSRLARSAST